MRTYQWTAEEEAEIAEVTVRFEIAADAEMAAMGYRPGSGLPFDGMPAELFARHPDEDDPRWVEEDDYPDYPDPGNPRGAAAGPARPDGADAIGQIVDALERVERDIAGLMGDRATLFEQARLLGETGVERTRVGSRQLAQRSLRAELGTALRIPERTIDALLGVSRCLVQQLPATLEALREGGISYRHAQVMVDHAADLADEARAVFEGQALPHAKRLTASKFNQKARIIRERLNPESITERHVRAKEDRDVRLDPQRDGMALLSQFLPAAEATAIFNRLTDAAISLHNPTEARTLAQLRADGYGPIDPATAKQLAAGAPNMIRLLTHPETGAILSVGRDRYRVPADLRTFLRIRDETCRFPGCARSAELCDIDHTLQWQHRHPTAHYNLAHLCPRHHTLKDETDWDVAHAADGTGALDWTSPTGRRHRTDPAATIQSGIDDSLRRRPAGASPPSAASAFPWERERPA